LSDPTAEILTTGVQQNVYYVDEFVIRFLDVRSGYFDNTVQYTWLFGGPNPTWPCDPPIFSVYSFTTAYSITVNTYEGYITVPANYVAPSPAELLTIPFKVYLFSWFDNDNDLIAGSETAE